MIRKEQFAKYHRKGRKGIRMWIVPDLKRKDLAIIWPWDPQLIRASYFTVILS